MCVGARKLSRSRLGLPDAPVNFRKEETIGKVLRAPNFRVAGVDRETSPNPSRLPAPRPSDARQHLHDLHRPHDLPITL